MSTGPGNAAGSMADPARAKISDLILELHATHDADQQLDRIVEYSRIAVGGDDAGVLLIHPHHEFEVAATTSDDVLRAHHLQIELQDGPCLDASEETSTVFKVDDLESDPRWPDWAPKARQLGFRSVIAAPLATESRRYGSLNVYARRPHAFDADDAAVAAILARHCSIALHTSRRVENLMRAMDARKTIGMAMGLIMARYEIDDGTAFQVLRRYSQAKNLKLRDVAARVVADRRLPDDW